MEKLEDFKVCVDQNDVDLDSEPCLLVKDTSYTCLKHSWKPLLIGDHIWTIFAPNVVLSLMLKLVNFILLLLCLTQLEIIWDLSSDGVVA
ncbi:unnamed protein product [Lactuca saligna]|uniref:Uncharacterized protein n=1 Tax=Lactuca saligna TaxID=75948 RepID=A0AA36DZY0_LACSI|nr:unnamed protein product [Lactuca saligna]